MTNDAEMVIYLWIYRKIRRKAKGNFILYSSVLEIIKRSASSIFFPHALYYPIIKDLEKLKLLKKISKRRYEIIGGNADILLNQYNCPI